MIFVNVDVPMQRWPIANWALIGITIFFSFAAWVKVYKHGVSAADLHVPTELQRELDDPALSKEEKDSLILDAFHRGDIHYHYPGSLDKRQFSLGQLITYQFVHAGFWHLFGNMLFLFTFGNAINAKLGHATFLLLYLGLGVFAGLGWMLVDQSGGQMIGASGAIAGITGVFFVLYPFNECAIHHPQSYAFTGDAWRVPSWSFILFYMAFDLWGTLRTNAGGGGIAYAAHLAGELAGICIAIGLVLSRWVTSDRGEQNLCEHLGWVTEPEPPKRRRRPRPVRPRPPSSDI